jgi:hypothetical protein
MKDACTLPIAQILVDRTLETCSIELLPITIHKGREFSRKAISAKVDSDRMRKTIDCEISNLRL